MAKVLVVDDDAAMRRMISRVMTNARHQVIEADNGLDGVRKFRAEAPQIIITDIVMPEQEGIEMIREIRADGSTVGIIAISGAGSDDGALYLTIAGQLGADAVLQKPFQLAELIAVVDRVLAQTTLPNDERGKGAVRYPTSS